MEEQKRRAAAEDPWHNSSTAPPRCCRCLFGPRRRWLRWQRRLKSRLVSSVYILFGVGAVYTVSGTNLALNGALALLFITVVGMLLLLAFTEIVLRCYYDVEGQ